MGARSRAGRPATVTIAAVLTALGAIVSGLFAALVLVVSTRPEVATVLPELDPEVSVVILRIVGSLMGVGALLQGFAAVQLLRGANAAGSWPRSWRWSSWRTHGRSWTRWQRIPRAGSAVSSRRP